MGNTARMNPHGRQEAGVRAEGLLSLNEPAMEAVCMAGGGPRAGKEVAAAMGGGGLTQPL